MVGGGQKRARNGHWLVGHGAKVLPVSQLVTKWQVLQNMLGLRNLEKALVNGSVGQVANTVAANIA